MRRIPRLFAARLLLTLLHAAEAKWLGYGSSIGKLYSARPTTTQRQDAPTQTTTAARPSGASAGWARWPGWRPANSSSQ